MQIFRRIWFEPKLADSVAAINAAAFKDGMKQGIAEGYSAAKDELPLEQCKYQDEDTRTAFETQLRKFEDVKFEVLEVIGQCAKVNSPIRHLREALEYTEEEVDPEQVEVDE